MPANPLDIALIVASTRDGRFGPTVAEWFGAQLAEREDMAVDVVDLVQADLPTSMTGFGRPRPARVEALATRLDAADAFVVVTPEYNHSYPAALKAAIDWYGREWQAKPVAFVSYGGLSGGLRAVEHLRGVFAEMHAATLRDVISFHDIWSQFEADGSWPRPSEARAKAVKTFLDQLAWWGVALREARVARPYAA